WGEHFPSGPPTAGGDPGSARAGPARRRRWSVDTVNFLRDVPLIDDVPDAPLGAEMADTEPVTEKELLVGGEQIHRRCIGTVIRQLVLLCHKGPHRHNGNHRAGGTVGGASPIGARS